MSVMKKILCSLLTASVLGSFMPVLQAAEPQENTGQTINRPPMVVEADEINFSDSTGDLVAKGNVVIDQDKAEVTGEVVRGNTKANEVWIDGNGRIRQPGMDITGTGTRYNFANHTGTMAQATGKVEKELISGKDVELKSDELVMHDGTWTRCPAKKPDYHMSATKAEIWPGDHMIVYNVKFWIKDTVILSLPSYRVSLKPGSGETSFPRVNFSSANGGSIRQHLEFPVGLAYYTHAGYKPVYGVVDHENGYQIGVAEGHYLDSNDNWIKKEPEFTLNFNKRQLGSLPINYTVGASYGKWIDDAKSSWHQSYNGRFVNR
ncbi:MAG: lptD 2 [Firmicutes bacterium]|nr:lptD 2 [Bacillota bacterium]